MRRFACSSALLSIQSFSVPTACHIGREPTPSLAQTIPGQDFWYFSHSTQGLVSCPHSSRSFTPLVAGVAAWAERVSTASLHDGLVSALSLEPSASDEAALLELNADWSDLDRAADDAYVAAEVAEDVAEQYEADAGRTPHGRGA